jgi:hypothetical protein
VKDKIQKMGLKIFIVSLLFVLNLDASIILPSTLKFIIQDKF